MGPQGVWSRTNVSARCQTGDRPQDAARLPQRWRREHGQGRGNPAAHPCRGLDQPDPWPTAAHGLRVGGPRLFRRWRRHQPAPPKGDLVVSGLRIDERDHVIEVWCSHHPIAHHLNVGEQLRARHRCGPVDTGVDDVPGEELDQVVLHPEHGIVWSKRVAGTPRERRPTSNGPRLGGYQPMAAVRMRVQPAAEPIRHPLQLRALGAAIDQEAVVLGAGDDPRHEPLQFAPPGKRRQARRAEPLPIQQPPRRAGPSGSSVDRDQSTAQASSQGHRIDGLPSDTGGRGNAVPLLSTHPRGQHRTPVLTGDAIGTQGHHGVEDLAPGGVHPDRERGQPRLQRFTRNGVDPHGQRPGHGNRRRPRRAPAWAPAAVLAPSCPIPRGPSPSPSRSSAAGGCDHCRLHVSTHQARTDRRRGPPSFARIAHTAASRAWTVTPVPTQWHRRGRAGHSPQPISVCAAEACRRGSIASPGSGATRIGNVRAAPINRWRAHPPTRRRGPATPRRCRRGARRADRAYRARRR